MKKIVTAFVLAAVCVGGMAAQDVIFRTQVDSIKAKIVTVSDEEITYRLADYDDGPMFSLKTKNIVAIRYGNGMTQYFADKVYDEKKVQVTEPRQESVPQKKSAFFLGATGMIGYTGELQFGFEPVLGVEINDVVALGTGIGMVVVAQKKRYGVAGIAEPFVRVCAWHNDLVYIDFKFTGAVEFTNQLLMAQVGVRPSLRFRLTEHCDLAADIGLFGAQYLLNKWYPAVGVTASSAGIWCVYRF